MFTGTPPYAFTFGLGGLLLFPLHAGASTVLVEKATPAELARIIDGIAATEMLHIFISAAGDDIVPGSTGLAVPGYVATVLDEHGAEAAPGVAGRLAVKGPTGCRYLSDPRQQAYVRDGWNITGDTFSRDAAGYFFYQARSDDMIVSSGYNIAAPEIEEALLRHPEVEECAVIGCRTRVAARWSRRSWCWPGRLLVRREGPRAAGLRQGRDRAVQVSPGHPVR